MSDNLEKTRYGKVVAVEEKLSRLYLDRYGREMPDDTPVAAAVGYVKQPSMVDHVRALVARELSNRAEAAGAESFEEANDFEVGDDYEPETPYEVLGGELGPLPPEVANMSTAERRDLHNQRLQEAQASSKKTTPAAEGGGGGSQETAPPTTGNATPQTSPASSPGTAPAGGPGQPKTP